MFSPGGSGSMGAMPPDGMSVLSSCVSGCAFGCACAWWPYPLSTGPWRASSGLGVGVDGSGMDGSWAGGAGWGFWGA